MSENAQLIELEKQFLELTRKLGVVQGEYKGIVSEKQKVSDTLVSLERDKELYTKAVELLTAVQKVSQEKIKEGFETIITHAIQYVFENDCRFELNFGRRGNLQELDFNLKQPGFEEAYDILDTDSGGIINIVSTALRLVLMEINTPRIEGFVLLDEPFTNISKENDYLSRARDFIQEIF